jgi:hypothetical protein
VGTPVEPKHLLAEGERLERSKISLQMKLILFALLAFAGSVGHARASDKEEITRIEDRAGNDAQQYFKTYGLDRSSSGIKYGGIDKAELLYGGNAYKIEIYRITFYELLDELVKGDRQDH